MARVIFSTWADSLIDNRGKASEAQDTSPGVPVPVDFDQTTKVAAFMGWAGFRRFRRFRRILFFALFLMVRQALWHQYHINQYDPPNSTRAMCTLKVSKI